MVNHEASRLRNKTRVLVRPVLLVALCAPAAAMALDRSPNGAVALGPADDLSLERTGAIPPLQVADAFAAGTSTFTLGLDVALSAEPYDTPGLALPAPATSLPRGGNVFGLGDVRAIAATMRQTPSSPATDPAKSDGSFGRWMKRHWWVPALIGAAVVATAGESLWDDDDVDDED